MRLKSGAGFIAAVLLLANAAVVRAESLYCAEVKLEIAQDATLEREAFDAHLGVNNGFPIYGLQNFRVDIVVKDSSGNDAAGKFYIRTSTMTGINAVDGTGIVQPASTADVHWLIIPSTGAGGVTAGGLQYSVYANVSYLANGTQNSFSTYADYITVKPQPSIRLQYFLPFEVSADEPATENVVEPVEPFYMGLRAFNVGYGTAKNFQLSSGQPSIVENKQGLFVVFSLLDAWVGAAKQSQAALDLNLGNVEPGYSKTAAWRMSSTLSGRFKEFNASFTHAAELGGQMTSLIEGVTTYTLVKDVLVDLPGRDSQFDFLVNISTPRLSLENMYQLGEVVYPDYIIESDHDQPVPVYTVAASTSGSMTGSKFVLTMAPDSSATENTWNYFSIPAPKNGSIPLLSVLRSDGKALNSRNFWISRHYNKPLDKLEYYLHVLDYLPSRGLTYQLTFDASSVDEPPAPASDLAASGVAAGSVRLSWTASGEDGLTGTIYGGKYAIFVSTDIAVSHEVSSAGTVFSTSAAAGSAESFLFGDLLGNATYQFVLWTADAQLHFSSASNRAIALTNAYPPQNMSTGEVSESSFTAVWGIARNNPGAEYMVALSTVPAGAHLQESGFMQDAAQYAFQNLTPNTTFYVHGLSRDSLMRQSNETAALTVATLARPPSAAAESFSQVFGSSVAVHWDSNGNPAYTAYRVEYSLAADFGAAKYGVFRSAGAILSELSSNTTYYFRVAAVNSAGIASAFLPLGETVTLTERPAIISVAAADNSAIIHLSSVSAAGYVVEISSSDFNSAEQHFLGPDISSFTVSGLLPDTTYYARAAGINYAGQKQYGGTAVFVSLASQVASADISSVSADSLHVTWSSASCSGYNIGLSVASDFSQTVASLQFGDPALSSATVSGLSPNQKYYCRVGTLNHAGAANYMVAGSSFTLAAMPMYLAFSSVHQSSATLQWLAAGNPSGTIYRVAISTDNTFALETTTHTLALSAAFAGLVPNTTYYAKAAAINGDNVLSAYTPAISTMTEVEVSTSAVVVPSTGAIGGPFTITGADFGAYAGASTRVMFGSLPAPLSLWSGTTIQGTVPGVSTGSYTVSIERVTASSTTVLGTVVFGVIAPEADSLNLSSAPIGMPFTLSGAGFGNYNGSYTRVLFGGTAAYISLWTDTAVHGLVPGTIALGSNPVALERATADGVVVRTAELPFTLAAPSVSGVSSSTGPIGLPFTIDGLSFGNYNGSNTRVLFGGTTAQLTLWTDTRIQGTIPGVPVGDTMVIIERATSDGGLMRVIGATFTVTAPYIASVTPSSGPIGVPFTLSGSSFGNYTGSNMRVLFGDTTAQLTLWTDTQIQGTIPGVTSIGTIAVSVERATADGGLVRSSTVAFTLAGVDAQAIAPSTGPIGLPFTITGSDFGNYNGSNTRVLFDATTAQLTLWNGTTIQGNIPGNLAVGTHTVVVERATSDGGVMRSSGLPFTVTAPSLTGLTPVSGPGGIVFTLSGTSFGNYNGSYTHVLFGGTTAQLTLWTDTSVQGVVPGGLSTGAVAVTLERATADGGLVASSSMTFTVAGLVLSTMTPMSAPVGVSFTIVGDSFGAYNGSYTRVKFDGTSAPLTLWNGTTIQGTIPGTLSIGTHTVIVERATSDGGLMASAPLIFDVRAPSAYGISPSTGPIGLPFTITGTDFGTYSGSNTRVKFYGVSAPVTLWNGTTIQGTIPGRLGAGSHAVVIERAFNGGLTASPTIYFTVTAPAIASVSPSTGPIGLPFTITGASFGNYNGSYTRVKFGVSTATITSWTDTAIACTVPGGLAAGHYALTVERATSDGGLVVSTGTDFEVLLPVISTMTPSVTRISTVAFTLTGEHFGNYSGANTVVLIGGTTAALTLWNDTRIQGTIPGSLAAGTHSVLVRRTANGASAESNAVYVQVILPEISTMTPRTAATGEGFTITGTGFGEYDAALVSGLPSTRVKFGSVVASLSEWTDTQIRGLVPDNLSSGSYEVAVERAVGSAVARSNTVTFTVPRATLSAVKGAAAYSVTSYPKRLIEAGLDLPSGDGGSVESWNRTRIDVPGGALPQGTFVSIAAAPAADDAETESRAAAYYNGRVSPAGAPTAFAPESALAKGEAEIALPYLSSAIPANKSVADLALYRWEPGTKTWTEVYGTLDEGKGRMKASVGTLGLYQVMIKGVVYLAADAAFKLGEVYAFPNPAKGSQKPTIHVEVGIADRVDFRIYDVAGDLRHRGAIEGLPQLINDGQGPQYAYEYTWDGGGTGVYVYKIDAFKVGEGHITATKKLAITR